MGDKPVICLMGPTASGKTGLAIQLVEQFPLDIVSVDSALVYRGMDIGTAKPDAATLERAPHRLIDIREPEEPYSAGAFVTDACREIDAIHAAGRIPLLVGGTMMYFRALIGGIAELPGADPALRDQIDREAAELGWPAMHVQLSRIDAQTAARIGPNDRQRIQRALEVYRLSGRPISAWQAGESVETADYAYARFALIDAERRRLHERINRRFAGMLEAGFLAEVAALRRRPGLTADSPSMRAVGYRQLWTHLDGGYALDEAVERAKAATRQLAKRQLTWLRAEPQVDVFDPLEAGTADAISSRLKQILRN